MLERRKSETKFQEAAAAALTAARGSYSPYRKVPSGVALVSVKGVHAGGCVENAAHNPTLQPLQAAFANALFDGVAEYSAVMRLCYPVDLSFFVLHGSSPLILQQ